MDNTIIAALIGVAGTLICVYIGFLLSSLTYKKTIKLQEFNTAASDFHAAFIEAQRRLDKGKSTDICHPNSDGVRSILNNSIVKHETAMIKFRPYLEKRKLASFDDAWKVYYSQNDNRSKCLSEYISKLYNKIKDPEHEEIIRELALSRIETLLSFTEIKNT